MSFTKKQLARWRKKCRRCLIKNAHIWVTAYDRYQEVQGVLTPHLWKRAQGRNTISVYLQWAYNGAELSTAEPMR